MACGALTSGEPASFLYSAEKVMVVSAWVPFLQLTLTSPPSAVMSPFSTKTSRVLKGLRTTAGRGAVLAFTEAVGNTRQRRCLSWPRRRWKHTAKAVSYGQAAVGSMPHGPSCMSWKTASLKEKEPFFGANSIEPEASSERRATSGECVSGLVCGTKLQPAALCWEASWGQPQGTALC